MSEEPFSSWFTLTKSASNLDFFLFFFNLATVLVLGAADKHGESVSSSLLEKDQVFVVKLKAAHPSKSALCFSSLLLILHLITLWPYWLGLIIAASHINERFFQCERQHVLLSPLCAADRWFPGNHSAKHFISWCFYNCGEWRTGITMLEDPDLLSEQLKGYMTPWKHFH